MTRKSGQVWRAGLGAAILLAAASGPTWAGAKKTPDGWTFEVSPYLWMASLSGDVGVFDRLPPSSVDINFNQLFNHINWPKVAMLSGEARNGRFGILGDVIYMSVGAEKATPGPLFGSAALDITENVTATLEGAYRIVDTPSVKVDGMAGARLFSVGLQLDLSPGTLAARSGSQSNTWVDPLIAARVIVPFGEGFYASAYGDVGGFGISGGDLTWQFFGSVGYNFNDSISAYAGFRYMDIQHQDGGFVYDVAMQGPMLGVGIHF
jgi:hypothetical protein